MRLYRLQNLGGEHDAKEFGVIDGAGSLLLSHNVAAISMEACRRVAVQNWTVYAMQGFRDKVRASWAALRFIWKRQASEQAE